MWRGRGHVQMLYLWIFEGFADVVDRATGHADRVQALNQLHHGELFRHRLNGCVQTRAIAHPCAAVSEVRILGQVRCVQCRAEIHPHLAGAGGNVDQPILGRIGAHRHLLRVKVALLFGNFLVHRVTRTLKVELAQHAFQQRRVHPLADAGVFAMQQRQQDALAEKHAGGGIRDRHAHAHGATPWLAGNRHETTGALHDLVNTRPTRIWSALSEAGNARQDDRWVDCVELFVLDAEATLHIGAKVLHHDVGFRDEKTKQRDTVLVFQIDTQTTFIAMQILIVGSMSRACH